MCEKNFFGEVLSSILFVLPWKENPHAISVLYWIEILSSTVHDKSLTRDNNIKIVSSPLTYHFNSTLFSRWLGLCSITGAQHHPQPITGHRKQFDEWTYIHPFSFFIHLLPPLWLEYLAALSLDPIDSGICPKAVSIFNFFYFPLN